MTDEFTPHMIGNNSDFEILSQKGTLRTYEPGETIFRRGDPSTGMFVIISGQVELQFPWDKAPKVLSERGYFGELSFVVGQNVRTATAVSRDTTRLVVLDQDAIDHLVETHPRSLFTLIRCSCGFLHQSEQTLIEDLMDKNNELEQTLEYLRRTKEELDYKDVLAQTDELTGLYNRRALNTQLAKFINRAHQSQRRLGILMVDLDGFKLINDTYGHINGDEVLKKIASILVKSVRGDDFPCRPGGDEFVLLLPDITDGRGQSLAEQIRSMIEVLDPVPPEAKHKVSGSIGGTMYKPGEDAETFLNRADQYLYYAKESGKNKAIWESQEVGSN